jgi:hypothetical protein
VLAGHAFWHLDLDNLLISIRMVLVRRVTGPNSICIGQCSCKYSMVDSVEDKASVGWSRSAIGTRSIENNALHDGRYSHRWGGAHGGILRGPPPPGYLMMSQVIYHDGTSTL